MGGVEKVICGFANEFIKRGYEVYIICLDTERGVAFCLNENVNLCYSYGEYNYKVESIANLYFNVAHQVFIYIKSAMILAMWKHILDNDRM